MSVQQSPGKKRKLSYNSIQAVTIKVLVGKNETTFAVVKQHICQLSDFFETACKDCWPEGQEGVVRLTEEDPVLFGIFATWVLHGSIDLAKDLIAVNVDGLSAERIKGLIYARFVQLIRLFVLGQFLQSERFRNLIVDQLVNLFELSYSHRDDRLLGTDQEHLKFIYGNTPSKSTLRQLLLDNIHVQKVEHADLVGEIINAVAEDSRSSNPNEDPNVWAKEFLADLVKLMAEANHATTYDRAHSLVKPWDRNSCEYHEHRDEDEDYSCT